MDTDKRLTAPYLPFKTFETALDLIADHNVPTVIDRTVFPTFSGASITQVLSALKFLHLIDAAGRPQERLHALVDKDNRKSVLKSILQERYASVIALGLDRTTPAQFDSTFSTEDYNVRGDTKAKAKTFFIKAAQFVEMPVSKLLQQRIRANTSRKKRVVTAKTDEPQEIIEPSVNNQNDEAPQVSPNNEATKTISLRGGGRLSLSANINLLTLKGADREFVFKLIDLLDEYESMVEGSETA